MEREIFMTDYSTQAQEVADAMNAVYENKQTNKKNSISGDYSSDNESYPTVKAVKAEFGTKVTSFGSTTSDSNYPSEKLVKTELDKKIGTSNTSGLVKNDGTIDTNTYLTASSNLAASKVKDSNAHTHLSTSANATQAEINTAIDTAISNLSSINAIQIVSTLPTADATTMGKLYIISESNKINVYYVESTTTGGTTTYSWHKMDADILDDVTVDWTDIQNNPFSSASPSDYAGSTHSHGDITSDGKIGSTSGKPVITTTGGKLTTGAFGTSSGQFAEGNHTHSGYAVTVEKQGTAETGYAATYIVKQGGTALSPKINVVDTTYTADNSTLQLSSGQFSIKNGGVGSDQIASAVKSSWLSTSDVASEIGAFATALANAINPSS